MNSLFFFHLNYLYLIFFILYCICRLNIHNFFMLSSQTDSFLSLFLLQLFIHIRFFHDLYLYFRILDFHRLFTPILNSFAHKYLILLR